MPPHLLAERDQVVAQLFIAGAVSQVPLARRDDLEGAVALLVELDDMREGFRIPDELAGVAQHLGDALLGAEHGLPGQFGVGGAACIGDDHVRSVGKHSAVLAENRAVGQVELTPPHDVGHVTESADHGDARPLVGLGERVGQHGNLDIEQRCAHGRAEEPLVALVLRVGHQRHTGRQQLGSRRLDEDITRPVSLVEGHAMVGRRLFAVFELGLRDRGAEVDVPQRGRHRLERLAALEIAQEGELRRADGVVADGAVGLGPVDAQTQLSEELLEGHLVLLGERLAQLDEVAAADRHLVGGTRALVVTAFVGRREVGIVGQRGVAAHAVVVLHATLGRKTVVVPAHRVEHRLAAHPLEAHLDVGVREGEHVPDVQAAGGGGRGSVDGVDPAAPAASSLGAIEQVGSLGAPGGIPFRFETFEGGLVGDVRVGHEGLLGDMCGTV